MTIPNPVLRRIAALIWAAIAAWVIALFLQAIWSALIVANLRTISAIPWAAAAIIVVVWLSWQYLAGNRPPASTSEYRGRHLRARPIAMPMFCGPCSLARSRSRRLPAAGSR